MKKAFFAAAGLALLAPGAALAGPWYVEQNNEFKGDEDGYSRMENELRIGYETKVDSFAPYVEVGPALRTPDGGDSEYYTVLEVGTKIKLTDDLSATLKNENKFFESGDTDWKVEANLKYKF